MTLNLQTYVRSLVETRNIREVLPHNPFWPKDLYCRGCRQVLAQPRLWTCNSAPVWFFACWACSEACARVALSRKHPE